MQKQRVKKEYWGQFWRKKWRHILADIKDHQKGTVTKTTWHWYKNTEEEAENKEEEVKKEEKFKYQKKVNPPRKNHTYIKNLANTVTQEVFISAENE